MYKAESRTVLHPSVYGCHFVLYGLMMLRRVIWPRILRCEDQEFIVQWVTLYSCIVEEGVINTTNMRIHS
jgi:hypothetical protein